jgi:hypothetical protein
LKPLFEVEKGLLKKNDAASKPLFSYIWHITHRCHQQQFLLKFARDPRRDLC